MNTSPKKNKIPGKKPSHREAMIHSQLLELIRAERIKTTDTKGRILKQRFDRLVTEAKKDTFASRRNIENQLRNDKAVAKLYKVILPRLQDSNSGYVLSARTLPRKGDNAPQTIYMIKGTDLRGKKSRLAAVLERQQDKPKQRGGGRLLGRKDAGTSRGGKKIDSTADTRRVST